MRLPAALPVPWCLMSFQNNTVVRASAGTGKTRRLVDAYIGLLEKGGDPLRILAVTFTEKAAAEMRDRIRTAIYKKLEGIPLDERGRWTRILALLPAAPISTIHGFCAVLLRDHGLAIGIDPSFGLLDEQQSLDLAREAAREAIRQEIRSGNEDVEQLFGDFGLERLVETIVTTGYWLNSLGEDSQWLHERVEEQRTTAKAVEQAFAEQIRKYGGDFEMIGALADEVDARKAKHPLRKRDDSKALLPRVGQIAGVSAADQLCRLIAVFAARLRIKKQLLSVLDFDDLLLGVRNLLKTRPDVRGWCGQHFLALLVDEFQDTDQVQSEIISLLAEDSENPGKLVPGKLMIVGDPKQSIYRFRRARVTVFFEMIERIRREGGAVEHLQDNYRSAPAIVEFSNRLSESMMDGRGKGSLPDDSTDLKYRVLFSDADRLQPKSDSPFLGITYVAAESGARAALGREMEAEAFARLLKRWKSQEVIQSWQEVAVLLRSTSNIDTYVEAFEEHGIPFYVVQGAAFYQKTEVSDLIAFLELVIHPDDSLLRTTVLTSSLFGVTFKDVLAGATNVAYEELVRYWVEWRDQATAAEILQDVIRKTNHDVVLMAQKKGRQRVANVGKLIEITRELARQGTTSLDEVVRHLRARAYDHAVREPEAQIVGQDDQVVRILTVHQAKGLEFDIVVIPSLAAKTGRASADRTFCSERWGLLVAPAYGLHRKPLPHSLILEAKEHDEDQQYEEEKRLLYVAVTRAKKMLVLGEGFSKQAGPWLHWMERMFESVQAGAVEKARQGKSVSVRFRGRKGAPDFSVQMLSASRLNLPEQLAFVADVIVVGEPDIRVIKTPHLMKTLEMTPSDLLSIDGCLRYFHWTRMLGEPEPGLTRDDSKMRIGSLAHAILETGLAPEIDVLEQSGLSDLVSVFNSKEWLELTTCAVEREMPFIMHLSVDGRDCWIRGRMDLVVPGGHPRVIDYKYATWLEGSEERYEVQMTAYCAALMKAMETDRAYGELWYLKPPMKVIRREYKLHDAELRLQRLIREYAKALESDSWPAADRSYCEKTQCGFRSRCWPSEAFKAEAV